MSEPTCTGKITIAFKTKECLTGFDSLLHNDGANAGNIAEAVKDNLARFRIWAGNIGAYHSPHDKRSADYRLRDGPEVCAQLIELLEELIDSNTEIAESLQGIQEDTSSRASNAGVSSALARKENDIHEVCLIAGDVITSLLKVSVLLRSATTRDRYARAAAASESQAFVPDFDIRHVKDEYPKVGKRPWLAKRLGTAIAQRRQFLRYSKDHSEKIARESRVSAQPENTLSLAITQIAPSINRTSRRGVLSTLGAPTIAETTASTVDVARLQGVMLRPTQLDQDNTDAQSESLSHLSSQSSLAVEGKLQVVRLDTLSAARVPFECPYCHGIVSMRSQGAWKKHVFRDLRAYVCTFKDCKEGLFEDRQTWFEHESSQHRRHWVCLSCPGKTFDTATAFRSDNDSAEAEEIGSDDDAAQELSDTDDALRRSSLQQHSEEPDAQKSLKEWWREVALQKNVRKAKADLSLGDAPAIDTNSDGAGVSGPSSQCAVIVRRCVEFLVFHHAENVENIFRFPGHKQVVQDLKQRFQAKGDVDLTVACEVKDIINVADLLKHSLRESPQDLLPEDLRPKFAECLNVRDTDGLDDLQQIKTLVYSLPHETRMILMNLFFLLSRIDANSDVNKMGRRNLSIVFAPTLNMSTNLIATFIKGYKYIFASDTDSSLIAANRKHEPGELRFKKDDIVEVTESAFKDWWKGNLNGATGIFPLNYVEKVREVRALYDFHATEEGELSFRKGDTIVVTESNYKDWWKGNLHGQTGIFPVNHVEKLGDFAEGESAAAATPKNTRTAVALYDSLDTEDDELGFRKGDTITAVEELTRNIWKGTLRGKTGLFPANDVQELSDSREPDQPVPASSKKERRARALFDFLPTEDGELGFRKGDTIIVLETKWGWWKGMLRGQIGVFPADYVEELSNPQEPDPPVPATSARKRRARALYDFDPAEEDELRFRKGDIIDVTEGKPVGDIINVVGKCEGWWGSLRGQTGRFPANHVEELFDDPETDQPGQAGLERDRRAMYGIHPAEEGRLKAREGDNIDFAARKFDEMYGTALDEPAESADDFASSVSQEREVARSNDVKERKEPWGDSLQRIKISARREAWNQSKTASGNYNPFARNNAQRRRVQEPVEEAPRGEGEPDPKLSRTASL
ncbi:hypothetical protein B0A54_09777 [Friedmanniomyces endolithicus]|uniref:Class E vacuolar protein-sorting machinery protein HSE1 n=1 Tax=Friedmanniomyces endolithicus TaxID=329885 RepID=A0A4U0US31_9PEZI|nr:hypothetical protein B0A54_09777 [Friedmanniomyces endolithicus]